MYPSAERYGSAAVHLRFDCVQICSRAGLQKNAERYPRNSHVLSSGLFALNDMYRVILDQLVNHADPDRRKRRIADVLTIVGSIALLSSPLPKAAAAELIGIPKDDLIDQLPSLASVLRVPGDEDAPLQLYHLSFRDFLVRNSQVDGVNNPYHVDEAETHGHLTARCLDLLENAWTTRDPVCGWNMPPGTLRSSVNRAQIGRWITPEIAYAASYCVEHLKGSGKTISDCGPVHDFLKAKFLHWLEALAWLGRLSIIIDHINGLIDLVDVSHFSAFTPIIDTDFPKGTKRHKVTCILTRCSSICASQQTRR